MLDAVEIGKLRPQWEGPFRSALAGPSTYTLALRGSFKCSPTVNVERLKPYHTRVDRPAQAPIDLVYHPGQTPGRGSTRSSSCCIASKFVAAHTT